MHHPFFACPTRSSMPTQCTCDSLLPSKTGRRFGHKSTRRKGTTKRSPHDEQSCDQMALPLQQHVHRADSIQTITSESGTIPLLRP